MHMLQKSLILGTWLLSSQFFPTGLKILHDQLLVSTTIRMHSMQIALTVVANLEKVEGVMTNNIQL